ncbi:hypothetical protein L1049_023286 [Liquidambar formosana]|uniref:RRM domain-containing protein n=1 Tax=Liquidambar formosana TaxID=63359 RepID=A0AAP0RZ38_LIQFO
MTGRGGRDRLRRDYPPRSEDKSHQGRPNAPPSRHLWVGNLSHSIDENTLSDHFLQFGELDSVAFQPGRSYAFINFKNEEEAVAALRGLQGFPVAGMPLRIEFAKAEKSSTPSRDEDYSQHRDEQRPRRDSRTRRVSPDSFYPDKSRMSEKIVEPSEVLWIGFPALLKVDEMILRKAFSPFGEIEKITVFPGRSYAFVRFRSVMAACRAKETLQGKLFGNPRVHICFAKSESGSSNSGRSSVNGPPSPNFKSNGRQGFPDNIRQDRNFGSLIGDPSIRSPRFISNLESGDSDIYSFSKKGTLWAGGNNTFEQRRFPELGPEIGPSEDMYEFHSSPTRDRGAHFRDFSPQKFPRKSPFYEDPWDLPEDAFLFHGAKKLKTGSFPPEKELPEYPFSGSEQEKHVFPRILSDFPQPVALDKTFESGPFGYKPISDHPMNLTQAHGERSDNWKATYDSFHVGSGSLPSNPVEWKRFTTESHESSLNEWKWEGTIAKGGTPVCRARCFPVGKFLDIMLPEFLDCTARTGLEMLAKHYYQAANAWVVFFVPESDADIGFYNEFMHYLGEKQRAAVAKLDDKNTLFLVPPSDFSEKVLKVPGKLSISGVVLRLEHPGSNFGSLHHPHEKNDTNFISFYGDTSGPTSTSPSGPFPAMTSFPTTSNLGVNDTSFSKNVSISAPPASFLSSAHAVGSICDSINENRHDCLLQERNLTLGPTWSPHHFQNSISDTRNVPSQASNSVVDPIVQEHHLVIPNAVQETRSSNYTTGNPGISLSGSSNLSVQETKPSISLSMPIAALQPEQLARLASSLLGQPGQSENTPVSSVGGDFRHTSTMNQSENPFRTSQRYASQNNLVSPELSTSQFGQVQQLQQQQQQQQTSNVPSVPHTGQRELQTGSQGNQQRQSTGMQEEVEADPQKRLQATLQLAAALLQQIQQGKGT